MGKSPIINGRTLGENNSRCTLACCLNYSLLFCGVEKYDINPENFHHVCCKPRFIYHESAINKNYFGENKKTFFFKWIFNIFCVALLLDNLLMFYCWEILTLFYASNCNNLYGFIGVAWFWKICLNCHEKSSQATPA